MELSQKLLCLFLSFLVFGSTNHQEAEALQCYVCDSCVDGTEVQEIQICGELPMVSTTRLTSSSSSSTTAAAATQPAKRPTTIAPSSLQTGSSTLSTLSSTVSTNVTTRVSTRRTTSRRTTTRRTTTIKEDSEENYSDYEESDENERRRRIALTHANAKENYPEHMLPEDSSNAHTAKQLMNVPKQFEPVCFMVKFRVNNTQMTNLGCTSMVKDNIFLTCQSLNRSDAIMEDCQLCGRNGCNKLDLEETNSDNDWDYPWFNSSGKMDLKILNYFLIFLLRKLLN